MVLLTTTPTIIAAVAKCRALNASSDTKGALGFSDEPSLDKLELGKPISHEQLVKLSKILRSHHAHVESKEARSDVEDEEVAYHMNDLLRGSQLYYPPPPPKPEPVCFHLHHPDKG